MWLNTGDRSQYSYEIKVVHNAESTRTKILKMCWKPQRWEFSRNDLAKPKGGVAAPFASLVQITESNAMKHRALET